MSTEPLLPLAGHSLEELIKHGLYQESRYLRQTPSAEGVLVFYQGKTYIGIIEHVGLQLVTLYRHLVPLPTEAKEILLRCDSDRLQLTTEQTVSLAEQIVRLRLYRTQLRPLVEEQRKLLIQH